MDKADPYKCRAAGWITTHQWQIPRCINVNVKLLLNLNFTIHRFSTAPYRGCIPSIQQISGSPHHISFCSPTGLFSLPFPIALFTLLIHQISIFVCVSTVQVPICGSNMTCGFPTKPGCTFGSSSKTSRPTDHTCPLSRAFTSAASSITAPRAVLVITTPFFIFSNSGVEMI
jgi:hypothetical protein